MMSIPDFLNVNEHGGNLRVCARLSTMAATEIDVFIMLTTRNGTSKATCLAKNYNFIIMDAGVDGLDYSTVSSLELIKSGSRNGASACVDVTILDDAVLEESQNFALAMTTEHSFVKLGTNVTTISIIDNDG